MHGILEMLTLVQKSHLLWSSVVYSLLPYEESTTAPWAKWILSTYSHPVSPKSILLPRLIVHRWALTFTKAWIT